ncbi:MAG: SH3 domain-containing protein [Anaerolineae bacterium]|nr:SH3 domain-containing protein [Anaerolineae bacterium]
MLRKLSFITAVIGFALGATGLAASQNDPDPPPPEAIDDVYDFDLLVKVDGVDARFADMRGVAVTAGSADGARGGFRVVSPVGGLSETALDTLDIQSITFDNRVMGSGLSTFTGSDHALTIDGPAWDLTFNQGRYRVGASEYTRFGVQAGPGAAPVTISFAFGDRFAGEVEGGSAALAFDPALDTLDVALAGGSVTFSQPFETRFTAPAGGSSASALHFDGGDVTEETITLAEAGQRFAPVFRSLAFHIDMRYPIASAPATAEMVWYLLLDLDGSPYTGLAAAYINDAMYGGLGADYILPLHLQDDGSVAGIGYFPEATGAEVIEVRTTLSADRQKLTVYLPLAALQVQAAAGGVAFAPDVLHWRVAAINYTDTDARPKDIYPELTAAYPAPPAPAVPPTPLPTATPTIDPDAPAEPETCRAVTNANVNLRAGPGTAFERIGGLDAYTEVRVVGSNEAGDWYRVDIEGFDEAWIAGELLNYFRCSDQFTSPIPTETPTPTLAPTLTPTSTPAPPLTLAATPTPTATGDSAGCYAVANANANLRAGPGVAFERAGGVAASTRLPVVGVNAAGDWYRVEIAGLAEGQEAWIAGELLSYFHCTEGFTAPGDAAGTAPAPHPITAPPVAEDACYAETIVNVNLRAGPGAGFKVVGGLAAGVEVQVIAINPGGQWYRVRVAGLPEDEAAWVAGFALNYFWCPNPDTYELPVE